MVAVLDIKAVSFLSILFFSAKERSHTTVFLFLDYITSKTAFYDECVTK